MLLIHNNEPCCGNDTCQSLTKECVESTGKQIEYIIKTNLICNSAKQSILIELAHLFSHISVLESDDKLDDKSLKCLRESKIILVPKGVANAITEILYKNYKKGGSNNDKSNSD